MQKSLSRKPPKVTKSNYAYHVAGNNYQTIINWISPDLIRQLEEMNRKLDQLYLNLCEKKQD